MTLIFFLLTPPPRRVTERVDMATRSRAMQQFAHLDEPAWSGDDGSEFEPISLPASPTSSFGFESAISEDLNLYDSRCVC
jgi:hypothetical protein